MITKTRHVKLNKISELIDGFDFEIVVRELVSEQYQKDLRKQTWKNHFDSMMRLMV